MTNLRRKGGNKCRSKVLEKVRGKGIQDTPGEAGHRRKQRQFIHCDRGRDKRYTGTDADMAGR